MKFYLSSCLFGNEKGKLQSMLPAGGRIGHIFNARDIADKNNGLLKQDLQAEQDQLSSMGFIPETLDLREYFGKSARLKERLIQLDGVWVSGGNTFVLRQAMYLSGFDKIFDEMKGRTDFLYGGYSAGVCVLCDSLKYIAAVDNPTLFPYEHWQKVIWEGLGVFNHGWLPHYDSDHFESAAIAAELQNCIKNKWLFKVLKDGEVIILN